MLNLLKSCQLCPRCCKVNRLKDKKGFCGAGKDIIMYNSHLHFGEEPPISGIKGSGTIFFAYCNSRCVYCQNYKFSQLGEGRVVSILELSELMLKLQKDGAHNINLVTPTHFVPQIIDALYSAKENGLHIPIVYNTSGYELEETLQILEGVIDIYLVDMRYSNDRLAMKYSELPDYVYYNRKAVKIMYNQVGDLIIENGIAKRGLIIRCLVLPNRISGIKETMRFIRNDISSQTHISLMSQYYPVFKSSQYPEINRKIKQSEYEEAVDVMYKLGLVNGWCQDKHTKRDRSKFLGVNFQSPRG